MEKQYYQKNVAEIFRDLDTSKQGLSDQEAKERLKEYGFNRLKEKKKISKLTIFLNQFKSFIVWILIVATIISFFLGETVDAIVILVIIIFNGIFGFIQEFKAEKSMEALRKLTALRTIVIRKGKEKEVPADNLVPGDVIIIETGTKIPADARLIEAVDLELQEASLTGESVPVRKEVPALKERLTAGDQKNMVFSSTNVTKGKGKAVVTATAMHSEIGKIAKLIQETEDESTPLQKKLGKLGRKLGIGTLIIALIIFVLEVFKNLSGQPLLLNIHDSFLVAIALAVAAIPEGLPAVVTISLAFGVRKMIKRNSLVRKLASVETLGSTDIICSDKTGTLTKSEMTVQKIFTNNKIIEVTGSGYTPKGGFRYEYNNKKDAKKLNQELRLLLKIGSLCNDSKLVKENHRWKIIGDPTEGALLVSARKANLIQAKLNKNQPRIDEIPFSSEKRIMITVHKDNIHKNKKIAYVKGAPDLLLRRCNQIYENGKIRALTAKDRKNILKVNENFAGEALRILAFAYKSVSGKNYENDLIFVGLQAMIDPPRKGVKESIVKCKEAGIKVAMITGDYKGTAIAIARELGIGGDALSSEELDKLSPREFEKIVNSIGVYARIDPEHKLKIVAALKKKGHIVAMTGDGVNDAPALKKADIGVSMGIMGTDVTKEASDIVLTDDHFSSIVKAVENGRGIYDNIKKFINYLLSSNVGEILVILFASLLGMPLPLTAVQLLWLNLVTDGLPAIALGVDPPQKEIMKKKPRNPKENIIDKGMGFSIISVGILIAAASLYLFHLNLDNLVKAQTIAFTSLVVFEIVRLQVIRSNYKTSIFSNKYLILAVLSSIGLQLLVIYTPLNRFFNTVPLTLVDWGSILIASLSLVLLNWIIHLFRKRKKIIKILSLKRV